MVFPYYSNGTLQDRLDNGIVSADERIRILYGIACALTEIHSQHLSHRDVKTANIMLDVGNEAVLCDFGSMTTSTIHVNDAKEAQRIQDWINENCSLLYRPPEMVQVEIGKDITSKADIWSLGCVWYKLLFSEGPFDAIYKRGDSVALAVLSFKFNCSSQNVTDNDDCVMLSSLFSLESSKRPSASYVTQYLIRRYDRMR